MLFEATEDDIRVLNDYQLSDILRRLLNLEATKFGVYKSGISVALNINTADGGIDGTIKWDNGPERTDHIPCRNVMYQCKATKMTPAAAGKEVLTNPKKKPQQIKPGVNRVLSEGGAYVLFTKSELNDEQIKNCKGSIRKSFKKHLKKYAETATIEIYDASQIKSWINGYLPAIVAVKEWSRRPVISGLQTWKEWGELQGLDKNKFITDNETKSLISSIRSDVERPGNVLRLVGLSGLGKTRLVYEAIRDSYDYDPLPDRVIYVNAADGYNDLPRYVIDFKRFNYEYILIVDDCDADLHQELEKYIKNTKMSLLTLDYNADKNCCINTKKMPRASNYIIKRIILDAYDQLNESDLNRIVEFSSGFPLMAVRLVEERLDRATDIGYLRDDRLLQKLLGNQASDKHKKVITALALFEYVGIENAAYEQCQFVAEKIVRMDDASFYECVQDFKKRGLIDKRGDYIRVIPRPLAVRLAADWWEKNPSELIKSIIIDHLPNAPAQLVEALCENIPNLSFLTKAQELVKELCGERAPFGQAEVLKSVQGSRLFRAFVQVNSVATANALYKLFYRLPLEELRLVDGDTRRNLVWALERLCFRNDTFCDAARVMLVFAAAENESWSNNATGLFVKLFDTFLSGTEAPPKLRLKIVDEALLDERQEVRALAIQALEHALETTHFMRSLGAEQQGLQPPLEDWRPKVWSEAFDYWEKSLERLTEVVLINNELREQAKSAIAKNIRGLMAYGRVEALDKALSKIVSVTGRYWPEALESIKHTISFHASNMPQSGKDALDKWVALLQPESLPERLKLIVSIPPYEHEQGENGQYIDTAVNRAESLAQKCAECPEELITNFHIILKGEQRQGYAFGKALSKNLAMLKPVLDSALDVFENIPASEANPVVITAMLGEIKKRDPKLWQSSFERITKSPVLSKHYVDFVRYSRPGKIELDTILSLINHKCLTIRSVKLLSVGHALSHLKPKMICDFIGGLSEFGEEGFWVALDILFMYCHGDQKKWEACTTLFKALIMKVDFIKNPPTYPMDLYHWSEVVKILLKSTDDQLAKLVGKSIFSLLKNENQISINRHEIKDIIKFLFENGYGDSIWPMVTECLKDDDPLAEFRLGNLLSGNREQNESSNIIFNLDEEFLLDWCRKNPEFGPKFVAKAAPLYIEKSNEIVLAPIANRIIDEFGDDDDVLACLSSFMGIKTWWGSRTPELNKENSIYQILRSHPKPKVREWAARNQSHIIREIEEENRSREESEWGIS